jgi:hypothetical protein
MKLELEHGVTFDTERDLRAVRSRCDLGLGLDQIRTRDMTSELVNADLRWRVPVDHVQLPIAIVFWGT